VAATPASTHRHTDLEEALAELARAQARTEAELSRLSVEMREFKDKVDATIANSHRQWGELSNKMGTLVEDVIAPGLPRVFCHFFGGDEATLALTVRSRRRHESERSRTQEFDAVVWGDEALLLNETRSRLAPEDIPSFVTLLKEARAFLPEAKTRKVVGALASFYLHPSLVTAGERQGLLMIGLDTGLLRVMNSPGFEPKAF